MTTTADTIARVTKAILVCLVLHSAEGFADVGRLVVNSSTDGTVNGAATYNGYLWISTSRAAFHIKPGSTEIVKHPEVEGSRLPPIQSSGKLWLIGPDIYTVDTSERLTKVNEASFKPGFNVAVFQNDTLWLVGGDNRLYRLVNGRLDHVELSNPDIKQPDSAYSIAPSGGYVWALSQNCAHAITKNQVKSLCNLGRSPNVLEAFGQTWIATDAGLYRFDGGKAVPIKFGTADLPIKLLSFQSPYLYILRGNQALYSVDDSGRQNKLLTGKPIVAEAKEGLWVWSGKILHKIKGGSIENKVDVDGIDGTSVSSFSSVFSIDGTTFISSNGALFKITDNRVERAKSWPGGRVIDWRSYRDKIWFSGERGVLSVDKRSLLEGDFRELNLPSYASMGFFPYYGTGRDKYRFTEAFDALWLILEAGILRIDPDITAKAGVAGGWSLIGASTLLGIDAIVFSELATPEIRYTGNSSSLLLNWPNSVVPAKAIFSSSENEFKGRWKQGSYSFGTESNTRVTPVTDKIFYALLDHNGNIAVGKLNVLVLGGIGLRGLTGTIVLYVFALMASVALAPYSSFCHRLVSTPWVRPLGYFNFIPALVGVFPSIQRYILKRYVVNLLAEKGLKHIDESYVEPGGEFKFELFLEKACSLRSVLVKGQSGVGKTTYLKFLALRIAQAAKIDSSAPIPIMITLATARKEGLDVAASDQLSSHDISFEQSVKASMFQNGKFLFLLDGLNELDDDQRYSVSNFMTRYSRNNFFVVTSQLDEPNFPTNGSLELAPLPEHTIRAILAARAGEELAEEYEKNGTTELRELLRVPQNLFLTIDVVKTTRIFPKDKRVLYETLLRPLFDRWKQAGQMTLEEDLYERAFRMLAGGIYAIDKNPMPTDTFRGLLELKMIALKGNQYSFSHDLVRAYLAAKHVVPSWIKICHDPSYAVELSWKPMFEFVVLDLLAQSQSLRELMFMLLDRNTRLGGELFSWSARTVPHAVIGWEEEFKTAFANLSLGLRHG
jgi:hypothetical protein